MFRVGQQVYASPATLGQPALANEGAGSCDTSFLARTYIVAGTAVGFVCLQVNARTTTQGLTLGADAFAGHTDSAAFAVSAVTTLGLGAFAA